MLLGLRFGSDTDGARQLASKYGNVEYTHNYYFSMARSEMFPNNHVTAQLTFPANFPSCKLPRFMLGIKLRKRRIWNKFLCCAFWIKFTHFTLDSNMFQWNELEFNGLFYVWEFANTHTNTFEYFLCLAEAGCIWCVVVCKFL